MQHEALEEVGLQAGAITLTGVLDLRDGGAIVVAANIRLSGSLMISVSIETGQCGLLGSIMIKLVSNLPWPEHFECDGASRTRRREHVPQGRRKCCWSGGIHVDGHERSLRRPRMRLVMSALSAVFKLLLSLQ